LITHLRQHKFKACKELLPVIDQDIFNFFPEVI